MIEWLSVDVIAHLWQSTLVIGVVWLMTLALRGNRALVRHRLWLAASVKFLVPFSWFVSLGAQLEWRTAPSIAHPAANFVLEEVLAPPAIAAVVSTPSAQTTSAWPWILASIWVVGVAGVVLWWWRQWRLVQAALNQAKPIALGSEYNVADLTVMSSAWTCEPGVVGIWRPVLLLPEGLAARLTPAQLNAVISHERCHIGRHDNLAAAVHMVVEAMFWFHPLVWWIERRLLDERERACDEAVVDAGIDPDEYVAGILRVCRFTLRTPLACVAGVSGAELRKRLESIVRMELGKRMTLTRRVAVALVATVLLGVPIVAGLVRTPVVVAAVGQQNNSGQKANEPPAFEVASLRMSPPEEPPRPFSQRFTDARVDIVNVSVIAVLRTAFRLKEYELIVPDSLGDVRVHIHATLPPGGRRQQVPEMLQRLLVERLGLVVHRESRPKDGYELMVAPEGVKMREIRPADQLNAVFKDPLVNAPPTDAISETVNGPVRTIMSPSFGVRTVTARSMYDRKLTPRMTQLIDADRMSMAELAAILETTIDQPVVDKTGLSGVYQFRIELAHDATAVSALLALGRTTTPSGDPLIVPGPDMVKPLGLKLERRRIPIEVVVLDKIASTPTEN